MGDLDTYKDKIIVFESVKASDTSRLVTRQPLDPINTQTSSPVVQKPAGIKPSFESASDENHTPPSAMSCRSFIPSRAMHGQVLHPGTESNTHSLPPSSDQLSQASRSHSHISGPTFRSSTLSHSPVGSQLTPHSDATTPLLASDHTVGSVHMAAFERYRTHWRDRVQVSYPDYNEGTHVFVSGILSLLINCRTNLRLPSPELVQHACL